MDKVVINGDDYGMNERVSRAIAQALRERLITDTTMLANGAYFDEAVILAREEGFLDRIGIHFNLTEGEPLTGNIAKIADFVTDGHFNKRYLSAPRALTDLEREAIWLELSVQVMRLERAGIRVSHADSHHYIHTYTHIAPIVAALCARHGIRRVRLNRTFDSPERPLVTEGRVDNSFWHEGFETTRSFGRLSDVRDGIPAGTEVMVHPDYDRSGVLIDRTGMRDGWPTGEKLFRPPIKE